MKPQKFVLGGLVLAALATIGYALTSHPPSGAAASASPSVPGQPAAIDTHGMQEYADPDLSFTFWYPSGWKVIATKMRDSSMFPGARVEKQIQIGPEGGVVAYAVASAGSTITDEATNHAAPIAQTKYFYDAAAEKWMIAYPEGTPAGSPPGTTTADVSRLTASGLIMLASGRRFDTSIIPLSLTDFLVVSDGGGSNASALAQTVALAGDPIASSSLSDVLRREADAYAGQSQ